MHLTLHTYLTVQIQQIIDCGPLHTLTWASRSNTECRIQLCVHEGGGPYISVQFEIRADDSKRRFDRALGAIGWSAIQADNSQSLHYYITRSTNYSLLFAQAEEAASFCERAMHLLWHAEAVSDVALLAARGPYIPLRAYENKSPVPLPLAA